MYIRRRKGKRGGCSKSEKGQVEEWFRKRQDISVLNSTVSRIQEKYQGLYVYIYLKPSFIHSTYLYLHWFANHV